VWRTVEREKVNGLTVVGDAVARPLLDAWDRAGGYDASSLFSFSNGGAPMSPATRERVFATLPHVIVADGFGSSEAGTQGSMRVAAGDRRAGASLVRFDEPAKPTIVVAADGNEVSPGSGGVGQVLAGGRLPLGYYKDPDKTARTFPTFNGQRYSIPGDWAKVAADGTIELLGRGSVSINTGGEKVFPEEVEEAVKLHPAVVDAVVVGIPDDRFGEVIAAVVALNDGDVASSEEISDAVRGHLAGFKRPRHVFVVDEVPRGPNGKADYAWAKRIATEQVET
jgi:acyl-CoA synthetase (AMP-forming)/AMP-acid ligase II